MKALRIRIRCPSWYRGVFLKSTLQKAKENVVKLLLLSVGAGPVLFNDTKKQARGGRACFRLWKNSSLMQKNPRCKGKKVWKRGLSSLFHFR